MVVVKLERDGREIYCVVFFSVYTGKPYVNECCVQGLIEGKCVRLEDIPEDIEKEAIEKAKLTRIDYWLGGEG